jgi:hypothetical protein
VSEYAATHQQTLDSELAQLLANLWQDMVALRQLINDARQCAQAAQSNTRQAPPLIVSAAGD